MEKLKNNLNKLFQIYLFACLLGFISALISQFFFPLPVAENTVFAYAPGWQREIAIWNLGLITLIICALKINNEQFKTIITAVIILITSLFGTNHLVSMILAQSLQIFNLAFTILNYLAMFFGIAVIFLKKMNK